MSVCTFKMHVSAQRLPRTRISEQDDRKLEVKLEHHKPV